MFTRRCVSAVLLASLAACASGNGGPSESVGSVYATSAGDPAVMRLRPAFLRRGQSTAVAGVSLLQVYLDNARLGGPETLETVPVESIRSIQYLSSSEATLRWGTNHTGPVILLATH
jgi:hypothetical protein